MERVLILAIITILGLSTYKVYAETGIVTGGPGTGSQLVTEEVKEFIQAENGATVEIRLTENYPKFLSTREALIQEKIPAVIAVAWDTRLDLVTGDNSLFGHFGENQPFDNITKHKRMNDDGRAADWVGLGWVRQLPFEPIGSDESACDPGANWKNKQCAFESGNDEYTIRVRVGHRGWPMYGFLGFIPTSVEPMNELADTLTSADWSEKARDLFFVVPDDEVRSRRKVIFELWDFSNNDEPIATVSGDNALPFPAPRGDPPNANSCGGSNAACPEFNVPPDELATLLGKVPQSGSSN